jgi:hypothetical protein
MEVRMMQSLDGGCHCGRIRIRVQGDLSKVTLCNCSICTMKGIVHLMVPREQFELLSGEDAITTYEFNTGVAKHTFCKYCGMHPFYVPRTAPNGVSVNVRCLEGVDLGSLRPELFDGQNWEQAFSDRSRKSGTTGG